MIQYVYMYIIYTYIHLWYTHCGFVTQKKVSSTPLLFWRGACAWCRKRKVQPSRDRRAWDSWDFSRKVIICIYVYIYMYVYMYICIHRYVYMYTYCVYIYTHILHIRKLILLMIWYDMIWYDMIWYDMYTHMVDYFTRKHNYQYQFYPWGSVTSLNGQPTNPAEPAQKSCWFVENWGLRRQQ